MKRKCKAPTHGDLNSLVGEDEGSVSRSELVRRLHLISVPQRPLSRESHHLIDPKTSLSTRQEFGWQGDQKRTSRESS